MNKEMYQALKYYQNRASELSSTVPEAKGCNPTPPPDSLFSRACTQKKEKDMYNNITLNPTEKFDPIETAQDHLIERLSTATETKISAARKAFGLENDERPRTPQGFVDRILAGKFVIPEDRKTQYAYDPTDYIVWRDPSIKKDEPGFTTAANAINTASDDVMDILIVKGAEAGLAAINEFKTRTIN